MHVQKRKNEFAKINTCAKSERTNLQRLMHVQKAWFTKINTRGGSENFCVIKNINQLTSRC